MADDEIPAVAYSGKVNVGGMTITVHVLDNGQRVIDAHDMARVAEWLEAGNTIDPEAVRGL